VVRTLRIAVLTLVVAGASRFAEAQTDTGRTPPIGRGRGGRLAPAARPLGAKRAAADAAAVQQMDPADRQAAIRLIRQAMNRKYRVTLGLNDQQMRTLNQTNQRYERQAAELLKSERETRQALRAAMADTSGPRDQGKIAGYIDQLAQAQHKRADMLDAEQKDLSNFLTPLQRAQYLGLKEQLDRRILQLRQQNGGVARAKADSTPPTR
jgi:hypothetical protein